jgi:hypothetical protein
MCIYCLHVVHYRLFPSHRIKESRIWKDLTKSEPTVAVAGGSPSATSNRSATLKTIFWRGTSTFAMSGYKLFDMLNFPFDRQILNLERLDFVWRAEKDDTDYFNSMKVVFFDISTESMLCEWSTYPACIEVLNETQSGEQSPSYASKFNVGLRIERKHQFYVKQIFLVTYLITLASCSPLALPPSDDNMGERLSIYSGGLLTLVAFKYGITEHLPSVPYSTFTDDFLMYQLWTVVGCTFETLFAFRLTEDASQNSELDVGENWLLFVVFIFWTLMMLNITFRKPFA